ncbi:Cytochrome b-c1 complex subunit 9 [Trichoplax sp. H2]|nr:Cytochrome b-c1 complex subunit 9 [Trichoplax sp. H2]|eukprot:RDD37822.1 Cytochrome b-c1 complex subunit 9 [Trichoplax sp. H2]
MVLSGLYNAIFRRSSTFALAILVGAVFFERAFDVGTDTYFNKVNRGKLFEDIPAVAEKLAQDN